MTADINALLCKCLNENKEKWLKGSTHLYNAPFSLNVPCDLVILACRLNMLLHETPNYKVDSL